eukprot:scaffold570_cov95-Isochrysis_galbana.AAC.5
MRLWLCPTTQPDLTAKFGSVVAHELRRPCKFGGDFLQRQPSGLGHEKRVEEEREGREAGVHVERASPLELVAHSQKGERRNEGGASVGRGGQPHGLALDFGWEYLGEDEPVHQKGTRVCSTASPWLPMREGWWIGALKGCRGASLAARWYTSRGPRDSAIASRQEGARRRRAKQLGGRRARGCREQNMGQAGDGARSRLAGGIARRGKVTVCVAVGHAGASDFRGQEVEGWGGGESTQQTDLAARWYTSRGPRDSAIASRQEGARREQCVRCGECKRRGLVTRAAELKQGWLSDQRVAYAQTTWRRAQAAHRVLWRARPSHPKEIAWKAEYSMTQPKMRYVVGVTPGASAPAATPVTLYRSAAPSTVSTTVRPPAPMRRRGRRPMVSTFRRA